MRTSARGLAAVTVGPAGRETNWMPRVSLARTFDVRATNRRLSMIGQEGAIDPRFSDADASVAPWSRTRH
jgi:hypothetical protein